MSINTQTLDLGNVLNQFLQACQNLGLPVELKISLGSGKPMPIISTPEKSTSSGVQFTEPVPVVDAMPEPLVSTEQAASILDVSKDTLNKYREQGRLIGLNMNNHDKQLRPIWKYRRSDLEEFIRSLHENKISAEQH